jgi:hypothetical protein
VIELLERGLANDRNWLELSLAAFRAGTDGTPVDDPLARQLIEARALLTLNGIDQCRVSLEPRPSASAKTFSSTEADRAPR